MSTFKPDVFNRLKEKGYAYESGPHAYADTLMEAERAEILSPPQLAPVGDLVGAINSHCVRFTGDEKDIYNYAQISTLMAKDITSSKHYLNVMMTFFISSLKKTYPGTDFTQFETLIRSAEKELHDKLRTEPEKDNTLMLCALLGIIEKLL